MFCSKCTVVLDCLQSIVDCCCLVSSAVRLVPFSWHHIAFRSLKVHMLLGESNYNRPRIFFFRVLFENLPIPAPIRSFAHFSWMVLTRINLLSAFYRTFGSALFLLLRSTTTVPITWTLNNQPSTKKRKENDTSKDALRTRAPSPPHTHLLSSNTLVTPRWGHGAMGAMGRNKKTLCNNERHQKQIFKVLTPAGALTPQTIRFNGISASPGSV